MTSGYHNSGDELVVLGSYVRQAGRGNNAHKHDLNIDALQALCEHCHQVLRRLARVAAHDNLLARLCQLRAHRPAYRFDARVI
jgi:hypothetical protein